MNGWVGALAVGVGLIGGSLAYAIGVIAPAIAERIKYGKRERPGTDWPTFADEIRRGRPDPMVPEKRERPS